MLFVKFFREVLVVAIVKPHGLKLACTQNKESHKFNVYQAGFIVIQRYCLQTKVISFDRRSVPVTPCICFSATESSLDVHEEWKYLSSKNRDTVEVVQYACYGVSMCVRIITSINKFSRLRKHCMRETATSTSKHTLTSKVLTVWSTVDRLTAGKPCMVHA